MVGVEVELWVMNDWRRALRVPGRRMKLTRSQRVRELAVELEVKTWDERQDEVRSS
jgi:outer membrane biogenesis lipoprotein LolB